jgi:hypothetical protein
LRYYIELGVSRRQTCHFALEFKYSILLVIFAKVSKMSKIFEKPTLVLKSFENVSRQSFLLYLESKLWTTFLQTFGKSKCRKCVLLSLVFGTFKCFSSPLHWPDSGCLTTRLFLIHSHFCGTKNCSRRFVCLHFTLTFTCGDASFHWKETTNY